MPSVTLSQKCSGLLAYVVSFFALIAVTVWFSVYQGGFTWSTDTNEGNPNLVFNLHPPMMILGFIVFPTQAVLAYRMLPMEHYKAKVYHFVCHIFGMVCVAIGLSAVITYHVRENIEHFYSLHSWFGIGTLALFMVQFVFGFISYCYPKCSFDFRRASLPVHQYLGFVTFTMAIVTSLLGIMEKSTILQYDASSSGSGKTLPKDGPERQLINWLGVGLALLLALVAYTLLAQVGRRRTIERASIEEVESLRSRTNYDHDY